MKIKTITTAALAALATIAGPAQAYGEAEFNAHVRLWQAVEKTGVSIMINPPQVCDGPDAPMGLYAGGYQVMVICQDNRIAGSDKEVEWTANDLDTLRHEAHHVAQDCVDGTMDAELDAVYKSPYAFGRSVLGVAGVYRVVKVYGDQGADAHTQTLEVEAFAVAEENNPDEQVADLGRYCF